MYTNILILSSSFMVKILVNCVKYYSIEEFRGLVYLRSDAPSFAVRILASVILHECLCTVLTESVSLQFLEVAHHSNKHIKIQSLLVGFVYG